MTEHPDLEARWLDLAEGTLPEPEARAIRGHLQACGPCAARYRTLAATHRLSARAGRLAATAPPPEVPATLEDRVLAEARAAAGGRTGRRRWTAALGVAAVAAALAVAIRTGVLGGGDRGATTTLRGALATLAAHPGVRGDPDPLAGAAQDVAELWRAGRLAVRSATARCPGGGVTSIALVDRDGAPALFATASGGRTDLHLYAEDGAEVASARLVEGKREDYALPPLSRDEAAGRLARPVCPDR